MEDAVRCPRSLRSRPSTAPPGVTRGEAIRASRGACQIDVCVRVTAVMRATAEGEAEVADEAPVVVIVATRGDRIDLLLRRCLPSIFAQQGIRPKALVVVEDDAKGDSALRDSVSGLARRSNWTPDISVIANRRTRGASGTGAWNTGADEARRWLRCGGWLAFLDDDDAWRDSYLARCTAAATSSHAALVVSGLLRIESHHTEAQLAPAALRPELFFETNPGIQSSNLFIALNLFEAIEGFDESLASTTDRDLMIRALDHLAAHPRAIARVEEHLVEHHVHGQPRVTTDRRAKHFGLDRFYEKYAHRMSPEVLRRSLDRAERLFGYRRSAS